MEDNNTCWPYQGDQSAFLEYEKLPNLLQRTPSNVTSQLELSTDD
jgi:hypothetical protein